MTCSILISELGLMTEVLNTCMEILTFFGKKKKEKKTKLISWHLELFYMCKFEKVNEISQNSSGRGGSSTDDLYPVNVSPPSICWVIQPHKNPMIQSQFYLTPRVRISISSHSMRQLLHSVVWNYHTESHLSNISMLAIIGRTISTSERSRLNIDYFSH